MTNAETLRTNRKDGAMNATKVASKSNNRHHNGKFNGKFGKKARRIARRAESERLKAEKQATEGA